MIIFFNIILCLLILLSTSSLHATTFLQIKNETQLSQNIIDAVRNHKIYSKSTVTDSEDKLQRKMQELVFKISGLHQKKCKPVLRKLSRYENFSKYLDFVKTSQYNDQSKRIRLFLSSGLLPFKMYLDFLLPRIDTVGVYPFSFDKGFLRGLKGLITIREVNNQCFFYTSAHWRGLHSGFPNFIFETFSSALSKLAMVNLFRITKTL